MTATGLQEIAAVDYHADRIADVPSLSRTIACLLCTSSPKHAWTAHPRLNLDFQSTDDEKFDVGTVAHDVLLADDESRLVLVDAADWRTKAAQEARDLARLEGKTPLLVRQWESVQRMLEATLTQLGNHSATPPLFKDGKPEQSLVWEEPGGVVCRARLDWLHNDLAAIDDFKTTSRSANPEQWSRSLFGAGYDLQAAFYLRGIKAVFGESASPEFRFAVQETYPPYALSVVALAPDALALAEKKVQYAIDLWRDCLTNDNWPAYPTLTCYAELPTYEETRWLERETREEVAA